MKTIINMRRLKDNHLPILILYLSETNLHLGLVAFTFVTIAFMFVATTFH
jgi:hypothetical protein